MALPSTSVRPQPLHGTVPCVPLLCCALCARQELVLIGVNLDEPRIRATLEACLLTDEEYAGGPAAWRELEDAFFGGNHPHVAASMAALAAAKREQACASGPLAPKSSSRMAIAC